MSETLVHPDAVQHAAYDPTLFASISTQAQATYARRVNDKDPIFRVDLPKGKLFDAYLAALPPERRQQMNCSCCRSFLNRFGGLVRMSTDPDTFGKLDSVLWSNDDTVANPIFEGAIDTMRKLVEGAKINYHFVSKLETLGEAEKGGFDHFAINNAQIFEHALKEPHEIIADEVQAYSNLSKFIGTTDQAIIDQVATFFKHDQRLKNQQKWVGHAEWLAEFKRQRDALPKDQKGPYTWLQVATQSPGRVDIKNSPIGKFIKNIIGGDSYDVATAKFLKMADGLNYMRPKAAPKAGTVQRAETIFEKLGLASALERRFLTHPELRGVIWSAPEEAPKEEKSTLFGHLKTQEDKPAAPTLPEINSGPISLARFMAEILPTALAIELDGNQSVRYNITSFTTSVDPEAKPILQWDDEANRNPVCGYIYHEGSPLRQWGITTARPKIVKIINNPEQWGRDDATVFGKYVTTFVFDEGNGGRLPNTPMFPETFRSELHEVRSVLEAHFRSKPLTPLEDGQKPVVGIIMPVAGPCFLPLRVTTKDAVVRYQIDRGN
jgi:hypothetical protein